MIQRVEREIRQRDTRLCMLPLAEWAAFEKSVNERVGNVDLFVVGRTIYARGKQERRLAVAYFTDGWMAAVNQQPKTSFRP